MRQSDGFVFDDLKQAVMFMCLRLKTEASYAVSLGKEDKEGPFFSKNDCKSTSIGELDFYYHTLLKEVQRGYPKLIGENIYVEREYSM